MKTWIIAIFIAVGFLFISVNASEALTRVRPYFRSNGTFVQPHYRTSPNSYRYDNWSTRGNMNPFNGRRGYRSPF